MGIIERDFIKRELLSLAPVMGMMAVLLGYLIGYAKLSPMLFWLFPLLACAFLLRMLRQAKGSFSHFCGVCSESFAQRVRQEYEAPHPICRVAYGEMHLLTSCIVCRHKRRLALLPVEGIVRVDIRFRLVGARRIPVLRFEMDTGGTVAIDFSVWGPAQGEQALAWLAKTIGEERLKVER